MSTLLHKLVERVYFKGIVFNQSWEDPIMDREALQITPDRDTVLSITSGGCNSLNLLCLSPKEIICLDTNPAQTYLMDLKLAAIRQLDYDDFFDLFGGRARKRSKSLYYSALREVLPPPARRFWDRNVQLLTDGIYRQGKLGLFLRLLRMCLGIVFGANVIRDFFQIDSLEGQREFYFTRLAPKIWRGPLPRMLSSKLFIHLAGMHPSQYKLIAENIGIERFVRERIEHLLTATPVRSNYFLAQAAFGKYLDCENVPPYLIEINFMKLKRNVDRVTNLTASLGSYLSGRPSASIDKFSLLDIFDWMDQKTFAATLRSVIRVASNGARFIYRSTVRDLLPPNEVAGILVGEPELASRLLQNDRSGLYSSFYIYRIVTDTPGAAYMSDKTQITAP